METEIKEIMQSNKIKLIKGQRGGYGWELTLLSHDTAMLKALNDEMIKLFGQNEVSSGVI